MPRHPFPLRDHTQRDMVQNRVYSGKRMGVTGIVEAERGRERERVEK